MNYKKSCLITLIITIIIGAILRLIASMFGFETQNSVFAQVALSILYPFIILTFYFFAQTQKGKKLYNLYLLFIFAFLLGYFVMLGIFIFG